MTEIHRTAGGVPAWSVDGLVQFALLVSGERVEPRLLGAGEAQQSDQARARFLGAGRESTRWPFLAMRLW